MSRSNDAIPTWSGFNYQGKIMLFYILKLMNQINKEKDGRVYSVNLEEIEELKIAEKSVKYMVLGIYDGNMKKGKFAKQMNARLIIILPFRNCVPIENRTINMHLDCIIIRFGDFNIL